MDTNPEEEAGTRGDDPFLFEPASELLTSRLENVMRRERAPRLETVDCGCGSCGCGYCFCSAGGCNCAIAIA